MATPYHILIKSRELKHDLLLNSATDFRLADIELDRLFQVSLPKKERDLLRIFFGIWAADRLVRRPRHAQEATGSREVHIEIEVAYPDFWSDGKTLRLIYDVLRRLSNDFWSFNFKAGPLIPEQLTLLPEACAVCQYSAGLDSASGLIHRVCTERSPVITVTAATQSFRGRIQDQLSRISERFGVKIRPVFCRTRLSHPPQLSRQERTQRMRGALFLGLGGAVASAVRAESVDVFENGIGAINLPPQIGMMLGAMAARGCHPGFLNAMGKLVSHVSGRVINFRLPMLRVTKAEAAQQMQRAGIADVARSTMSCIHWPLRNKGAAKQCGICFGCLGRRQALLTAGLPDPADAYEVDLFEPHSPELYRGSKLLPLKACLKQIVDLRHLCETGIAPPGFFQHLANAEVTSAGMNAEEVIELHRRYAMEWQPLIANAKEKRLGWASWIKRVGVAA